MWKKTNELYGKIELDENFSFFVIECDERRWSSRGKIVWKMKIRRKTL